jgi:hypothetical protein
VYRYISITASSSYISTSVNYLLKTNLTKKWWIVEVVGAFGARNTHKAVKPKLKAENTSQSSASAARKQRGGTRITLQTSTVWYTMVRLSLNAYETIFEEMVRRRPIKRSRPQCRRTQPLSTVVHHFKGSGNSI